VRTFGASGSRSAPARFPSALSASLRFPSVSVVTPAAPCNAVDGAGGAILTPFCLQVLFTQFKMKFGMVSRRRYVEKHAT